MPCIEPDCVSGASAPRRRWPAWLALCAGGLLGAGCSQHAERASAGSPTAPTEAAPARPHPAPGTVATVPRPPAPPAQQRPARNWDDYRQQAARRLLASNPGAVYDGPVPEPLLAIPVLEIELNGDGSVRRIQVLRKPTQAHDTVQLAMAAVQRAAPFGSVTHLPRPWKFTETFLFDEQRRFKPRSLDG